MTAGWYVAIEGLESLALRTPPIPAPVLLRLLADVV